MVDQGFGKLFIIFYRNSPVSTIIFSKLEGLFQIIRMSFICCDAEVSHDIVAILENRLTKTIREHFMNRYTNLESAAVKSVVVDLNTQYIKFIKALFPNARIIIDRFHIVHWAMQG